MSAINSSLFLLPDEPDVDVGLVEKLRADYEAEQSPVAQDDLEGDVLDRYHLDLSTRYGGQSIKNPFGKASGQLSIQESQVQADADAGLGYCVLKTLIAQDETGEQAMAEWAVKETRMVVERIRDDRTDREGWTVSWKGRGWWGTFERYLDLVATSLDIGAERNMLVVPSVKYHLPMPGETMWKVSEYEYTTRKLVSVWRRQGRTEPLVLEKDFSPTLAGSDRARQEQCILDWLATVPVLVRQGAAPEPVRVGLKVFNALFEDEYQVRMLRALHEARRTERADFLIYANRLFDPDRTFDGRRGIAYGGPALSARNLRALTRFRQTRRSDGRTDEDLPISATGDIATGQMAVEYLLRGCENFQMHTLFQLPDSEYRLAQGNKSRKGLHELLFHPRTGFIVWMHHLDRAFGLKRDGTIAVADGVNLYQREDVTLFEPAEGT